MPSALFDVPKVLLLLLGIVTAVTLIRGFFPPEKVRNALVGRGEFVGTVGAAGPRDRDAVLLVLAVPLFIGFVEAGIPLGVTFSFLISRADGQRGRPRLLWGLFGPGIALVYVGRAAIAIAAAS